MVSVKALLLAAGAFTGQALAAPTTQGDNNTLVARAESVRCFNVGTKSDRAPLISAIDNYCSIIMGQTFSNGREYELVFRGDMNHDIAIFLKAKVTNGCSWYVDSNCNRLLRKAIDSCNTGGENGKQGGVVTDPCSEWTADPGRWSTGDHY